MRLRAGSIVAIAAVGGLVAASTAVAAVSPPAHAATADMSPPATNAHAAVTADVAAVSQARAAAGRAAVTGRKGQRLTVTPTRGLSPFGQTVKVSGRGFSELVGIYVGLCVMPRPGAKPTPCGGGVDQDGSSQASAWISSNPPPYGANLAKPYKRGGKFTVRIKVSPRIGSFDCRVVRCAVIARADHTRANDRTWDVAVPVTFR
ncbi:MAG: hypothetical protein ACO4AG_06245 [Candidatus Nanopelagicales bacterium]|jgi:hypothetical protein